ncbi:MAG: 1-(5-phosphoribosyl)-5-[(5-phosphoribosylamino)methylideneamino] imidazole-4-carboxamide isomerase [Candidatus Dormiibacterota bacterium]
MPALDLRGGRVVRLRTGDFAQETAYTSDPLPLALAYREAGATRLHVVDLDAARGAGDQRELVRRLVSETDLAVQVAGGVREEQDVERWLAAGAAGVVMGTTAVRAQQRLRDIAAAHPGRVQAALDVRAGTPAVAGWLEADTTFDVPGILGAWAGAALAGVILTSIDRDGTLAGPDIDVLAAARRATAFPLTYSGGIARVEDLAAVAAQGADAVILGKSLLEGRFTLREALVSPACSI